nr:MAG: phycobilisome rod-core linker polypeptide CpcG [Leptolyngbya sp. IPPAS B-1204]
MAISPLAFAPASDYTRVASYEVPGDEHPRRFTTDSRTADELEQLIHAAYRQIFHEQQMLACTRQLRLESQLRAGQITVKQFIRGLLTSDAFRRLNYEVNNNYRFVDLVFQRVLGRSVFHQRETLAWAMIVAAQGWMAFIDALLESPEYTQTFGDHTVPFQRRRILPHQRLGHLPFQRTPRYGPAYRLSQLALAPSPQHTTPPAWQTWPWPRIALLLLSALLLTLALLTLQSLLLPLPSPLAS